MENEILRSHTLEGLFHPFAGYESLDNSDVMARLSPEHFGEEPRRQAIRMLREMLNSEIGERVERAIREGGSEAPFVGGDIFNAIQQLKSRGRLLHNAPADVKADYLGITGDLEKMQKQLDELVYKAA